MREIPNPLPIFFLNDLARTGGIISISPHAQLQHTRTRVIRVRFQCFLHDRVHSRRSAQVGHPNIL